MTRSAVNFLVDALVASLFLAMLGVAAIVHLIFPPATLADGWTVWGLGYDGWSVIELAAICLFSVGVLVHLILHWAWVCGFVTTRLSKRLRRRIAIGESAKTLYGVGTLLIALTILGVVLTAARFALMENPDAVGRFGGGASRAPRAPQGGSARASGETGG